MVLSPPPLNPGRSPGRFAPGRTRQLSRELLPAATRRENKELKTDAPSGHGLAAALGAAPGKNPKGEAHGYTTAGEMDDGG